MLTLGDLPLVPYVLGYAPIAHRLLEPIQTLQPVFFDITAPDTLPFYQLVNAGNNMSYGGLGMPPWVQLDCATLPSAMIGFATERRFIPQPLWQSLLQHASSSFGDDAALSLSSYDGLVPVSEYCATPTLQPDTVVGFSLFTILPKRALGVRTKALALLAYNTPTQLGMTQYTNSAVTTHTAFGPLHIVQPQTPPHSRPLQTFIYRLHVPNPKTLHTLIQHGPQPLQTPPHTSILVPTSHPNIAQHIQSLIQTHGPLSILTTTTNTRQERLLALVPDALQGV